MALRRSSGRQPFPPRLTLRQMKFTVENGGASSEPPKSRTRQQDRVRRWTDKIFVIPSAVAGVIAKIGTHSFFAPQPPPAKPPTTRRHRGFYVWTPSLGPNGKPSMMGGVYRLIEEIDPATGEIKVPKEKH